jgi:small-conductance mechanosensitive channel
MKGGRMDEEGFDMRIRDIRRRIEELRARLYSSQQGSTQNDVTMAEQQQDLGEASKKQRDAELNNIRAKLMKNKM